MRTADFDYDLPSELIAQTPIEPRDASRLFVLHRQDGRIEHRQFRDLGEYLRPGDVLVANDTRVIPARLYGRKEGTGGRVELLLLTRRAPGAENAGTGAVEEWEALVRPGRRLPVGARVEIDGRDGANGRLTAQIVARTDAGRLVRFEGEGDASATLARRGIVPLPPYIRAPLADAERYQTVYAQNRGSTAAPTAGLHFTPQLIDQLRHAGLTFAFVTLHIGLDTFKPVQVEDLAEHQMHSEFAEISATMADTLNQARQEGRRVIAVGTTAVRVLETAVGEDGKIEEFRGHTKLFIHSGYRFKAVDALITNFHLPRSSLLMLVSAFAGHERVLAAYAEAARLGYRFYSFGDAMLMV